MKNTLENFVYTLPLRTCFAVAVVALFAASIPSVHADVPYAQSGYSGGYGQGAYGGYYSQGSYGFGGYAQGSYGSGYSQGSYSSSGGSNYSAPCSNGQEGFTTINGNVYYNGQATGMRDNGSSPSSAK